MRSPLARRSGNGSHFVLEDLLELEERRWKVASEIPATLVSDLPVQGETLRPSKALFEGDRAVMLLKQVEPGQDLDRAEGDAAWRASPTTKIERLLRDTGVEVALLTNGEQWRLVVASPSEIASWITWTAQGWSDSLATLVAFVELLGASRWFAGPREGTVIELVRRSRERQLDVADQLGTQARETLRLFVHELDRVDHTLDGALLAEMGEAEVYEAAAVLVMRLLFVMYAEENGLLPHGNVDWDRSYGVLRLVSELEELHRVDPVQLSQSSEAYAQLLATFRVIQEGSYDPDMPVVAHGGRLFDSRRYPALEGIEGVQPPPVRDSVIREMLRSLRFARVGGVQQLVSYQTLEVEQVGYMYEALLDRTVRRAPADDAILLLRGEGDAVVDVPSAELRGLDDDELARRASELSGRTEAILVRALERARERGSDARLANLDTDDPELIAAVGSAHPLVVDRGVVRPSGLYVAQGLARREQGAHYTPPSLTEPMVRTTLEPQVFWQVEGQLGVYQEPRTVRSPRELLDLKVCDPAMGSGAFLVQAVRYLAERLVDSWERVEASGDKGVPRSIPYAEPAAGTADELLLPQEREERLIWAKRLVAERCTYGVDKNPLAVEMAKLSLWLETLSAGRPFTFLDHSLRWGDSLTGVTGDQIQRFSLDGIGSGSPLFEQALSQQIDEASMHRRGIEARPTLTPAAAEAKSVELEQARAALAATIEAADELVSAFLNHRTRRERDAATATALLRTATAFADSDGPAQKNAIGSVYFHWPLEFPEVFERVRPGFDAFVGNPPFMGAKLITPAFGRSYREYLVEVIAGGQRGNADLVVYFLLRMVSLLRQNGTLGMLAVNTVNEGDSLDVGLGQIEKRGAAPFEVWRNVAWPGEAAVRPHRLFLARGRWQGDLQIDGESTQAISPRLDSLILPEVRELNVNRDTAFLGSVLRGEGFILERDEGLELMTAEPRAREVVFPYLIGADINSDPAHAPSRMVVCFWDWDLEACRPFGDAYRLVEERVKPERQKVRNQRARESWWRYNHNAKGLYHKIGMGHYFSKHPRGWEGSGQALHRVIACSVVSKYLLFVFEPLDMIYAMVAIFAWDDEAHLALLSSSIHDAWARDRSGTRETRLRYAPSDAFLTLPLPDGRCFEPGSRLSDLGHQLDELRVEIMTRDQFGLTALYNHLHDSSSTIDGIEELRTLQVAIDQAVLDAYGWVINLGHDFREVSWLPEEDRLRFAMSEEARSEVLLRLAHLNYERAEQEATV